ncbi:MAG: OsmC family protein [Actinomycetota bacterium]
MTTTINTLNSVNIAAVGDLVSAIQGDSSKADTIWKSTVEWKGGFRSEARSRDFAPIASDEPIALGGENTAPNPVEQVLGAFGSCLAVGYAANATASGIELKSLKVELEGDLDLHAFLGLRDGGHAGFESVKATVSIESDAPADEIDELHRKVVSTSPVGHTLQQAIPLKVELV